MQKFKTNLVAPLQTKLHTYDPVHEVCRFLTNNYIVLSNNFDDMINANDVSFGRRMKYYFNFVLHLAVMFKYIILMNRADNVTAAMFGESLHIMGTIHHVSGLCLSISMTMVPILITLRIIGDQYVAKIFQYYCHIDCTVPFNRINNRKLSLRMWLMSKMFTKFLSLCNWFVFPSTLLFCSIRVYLNDSVNNSIIILAISSVIQLFWFNNAIGIAFTGAIVFFMALSRIKLRYAELINEVKVKKGSNLFKLNNSYNHLVQDVKKIRKLFNPLIGIIYLSAPFIIGHAFQIMADHHIYWLGRIIGLTVFLVASTSNYIIYSMASSICFMNKIIVKLLYPIQFDKNPKKLTNKLKIDSLIARLNKEFVGFHCLYFIKFTKLSFYNYVLGLTTVYFLINKLMKEKQDDI